MAVSRIQIKEEDFKDLKDMKKKARRYLQAHTADSLRHISARLTVYIIYIRKRTLK